jgi:hypothetical protein
MKSRIGWTLAVVLLTLSACTRKNDLGLDSIIYQDPTPDLEVMSVRYFSPQSGGGCLALDPNPVDSLARLEVDMDGDTEPDFRITTYHNQVTTGECGPCMGYAYNIAVIPLDNRNYIATRSRASSFAKLFAASEVIEKENHWNSYAYLAMTTCVANPLQTDFENAYLGVRLRGAYGYIHVEKVDSNGVRVLELGLNENRDGNIYCGQQ